MLKNVQVSLFRSSQVRSQLLCFLAAACHTGQYVLPSNGSCQPCPANTQVDRKGVPICQCLDGYFRAVGESADYPCTRKCWSAGKNHG